MHWIAPSEKDTDNAALEKRLWDSADQFRANSALKAQEYSGPIPATVDYDAFGHIYEYFLGEFARNEGQKGGEFYTPSCIVRLLTEVIEPYHGRILDPACGSGGMFVSSARFVAEHKENPSAELSIHGVEKTDDTGRVCRLNLAVHGLEGDILRAGDPAETHRKSRCGRDGRRRPEYVLHRHTPLHPLVLRQGQDGGASVPASRSSLVH